MIPDKPTRKLIRLKDYDYAQNGAYFVTVCTHGRRHLWGSLIEDAVALNEAGAMVAQRVENILDGVNVMVDKYAVMPNPHSRNNYN